MSDNFSIPGQEENNKKPDIPELNEIEVKDLPLSAPSIPVTRFNRKIVLLILSLIGGVVAISLIWAFSPRKSKTPQEIAQEQSKQSPEPSTPPALPDNVVAAPASYSDMKQNLPPGVPRLGPQLAGDMGPAQLQQQRELEASRDLSSASNPANPTYTTYPAGTVQPQLTPEQQSVQSEAEQRRKDAIEARRSSLSFGGGSFPSGNDRSSSNNHQSSVAGVPGLDSINGLSSKLAAGKASDDDQNMQDEKRNFYKENRKDLNYLTSTLQKPISPFELKAGSIFPSVLITGINSDLPGFIVAQVRENVFDTVSGRHLLIPQGTKLVGEYDSKISYGQERVLVVWTRLILPNGNTLSLEGMPGVDLSGYSGLKDKVNHHYWKLVTGVVLGSVIGAGAQVATGGQGSANTPASFGQLAVSGAAQNINQAGQQITQKNLNMQPTIEIRPGMKLNVFVTKDIILQPLKGR